MRDRSGLKYRVRLLKEIDIERNRLVMRLTPFVAAELFGNLQAQPNRSRLARPVVVRVAPSPPLAPC